VDVLLPEAFEQTLAARLAGRSDVKLDSLDMACRRFVWQRALHLCREIAGIDLF
jgi:hypothetical protein